jgi:HisJ family histidinol phosphate phosphatase
MILTNYHMHSLFSDGKAFPEEYVKIAIEKGFRSIGFSEHGPTQYDKHWELPADKVDEYFAEINRLKEKYKDKIDIYVGMELDYFTGIEENGRAHFMTKRFDRKSNNEKLHVQTFCAIQHYDFNDVGIYSYEQLFETMRLLGLPYPQAII